MLRLGTVLVSVLALVLLPSIPAFSAWQENGNSVCTAESYQWFPVIVADGCGGAFVAWEDLRSSSNWDMYCQRVDSTGVCCWTSGGIAVCTEDANQSDTQILSDGAGGAVIVWVDNRGGDGDIYAQRIAANGVLCWPADVPVCAASGHQLTPQVISDGSGGIIVVWGDYRGGSASDIYAQRVDALGVKLWDSDGIAVCTAVGSQCGPVIASDIGGGAIISWDDSRSGEDFDIYAQRVNGYGEVLWEEDGKVVCGASGNQNWSCIIPDGEGGVIIAWRDGRAENDLDIYAQRVDSSGAPGWAGNGIPICTAGYEQYHPVISGDGVGGAIIAWIDSRDAPTHGDGIYAQRVSDDGNLQWETNGVCICNAAYDQISPEIMSDAAGGAIISWTDKRNGNGSGSYADVHAEHVDSTGVLVWGDVLLCDAMAYQGYNPGWPEPRRNVALASDSKGGALFVWSDFRSNSDFDVYGARIWAEGSTISWGTPLCASISEDTTLNGVYLASRDVTVSAEAELTLSPGCILRFATEDTEEGGDDSERCELVVYGTLTADGTAGDRVVLTSAADDPAAEDWLGVRLKPSCSDNVLNNCIIEYTKTGIKCDGAETMIDSCLLSDFYVNGIEAAGSVVTVTSNSITAGTSGKRGILLQGGSTGTICDNVILAPSSCWYGIEVSNSNSVTIQNNHISGTKWGLKCGGGTIAQFLENTITQTTCNAIQCVADASVTVRDTRIDDFTGTAIAACDLSYVDVGTSFHPGNNSVESDSTFAYYVANLTENEVQAEYCWWGTDNPSPKHFSGSVDYQPWLCQKPEYSLSPVTLSAYEGTDRLYGVRSRPNPFDLSTTISVTLLGGESHLEVRIWDICGRVIKKWEEDHVSGQQWFTVWNGRTEAGVLAAPGVYILEARVGNVREERKLVMLR